MHFRDKPEFRGPVKIINDIPDLTQACSILCQKTNPAVICVATITGLIHHYAILPLNNDVKKSPVVVLHHINYYYILLFFYFAVVEATGPKNLHF